MDLAATGRSPDTDGSAMSNAKLETISGSDAMGAWEKEVLEVGRSKCANCGSDDRVKARMVVPLEAGGKLVLGNGILLCRTCELTLETAARYSEPTKTKRPVNFWVSRKLYDRLNSESEKTTFRSMAGLIRFLMTKYVSDPDRFDDLTQYQDAGTDVKVNVWVESDIYARFKELVDRRGQTVTDSLKGLICLFEHESAKLFDIDNKKE